MTAGGRRPALPLLLCVFALGLLHRACSIRCLQCDAVPQEEVPACRAGRLRAQHCPKVGQTHCVTHLFKMISTGEVKVMWRRCGTAADVQNCTTWRVPMQAGRGAGALFNVGAPGVQQQQQLHRRHRRYYEERGHAEAAAPPTRYEKIKVCSFGCDRDACLIAADGADAPPRRVALLLAALAVLILNQYYSTHTLRLPI